MNPYLRFAPRELELWNDWSQSVLSTDGWVIAGPVGDGESGSSFITRSDGLRGIAKPALQNGDMPRAAHEKIASDLALEVGVPVPPVILWTDPLNKEHYAISAMAFEQTMTWAQSQHLRSPVFDENCKEIFAGGFVFHNWIGDGDHGGHAGNLVVDMDSGEDLPGVAFIDHAFSMSQSWTASAPIQPIGSYYCPIADLPLKAMVDAVERARSVRVGRIEEIVRRIPLEFLSQHRADIIIRNLIERREQLTAALGL